MLPIIRIVVADDHPFVREGIRVTLEKVAEFRVLAEVSNNYEVQNFCQKLQPEVLLLDLNMPGPPVVDTIARLHSQCPNMRIIILTATDDPVYVRTLRKIGINAYLLKEEMPRTVVTVIFEVVRAGKNDFLTRAQVSTTNYERLTPSIKNPLTPREMGVLQHVVVGKTNSEIGAALGISEKTVEKHLGEIFSKLDVTTRVEAAVWAVRSGLA
jgi:DNA-binding NarL/FixJ family response regulator